MDFPLPWLVILAALIGHFGLNVAIYNRINGTAIPRWTLKRITKVLLAWTLLGPILITFFYYEFLLDFFWGQPVQTPLLIGCYSSLCFLAWVVFGIPWIFGGQFSSLNGSMRSGVSRRLMSRRRPVTNWPRPPNVN